MSKSHNNTTQDHKEKKYISAYNAFLVIIVLFVLTCGLENRWTSSDWILAAILFGFLLVVDLILVVIYYPTDNAQKRNLGKGKSGKSSGSANNTSSSSNNKYYDHLCPIDCEAVILAEGLFDRLVSMKLEKYLMRTYIPKVLFADVDFQSEKRLKLDACRFAVIS